MNGSQLEDEYADLAAAHRRLAGLVAGLIETTIDAVESEPIALAATLDYADLRELAGASSLLLSEVSDA